MNTFSGAAPRAADDQLFRGAAAGLKKLAKQSRKELRQGAREEYMTMKQQADAQAAQDAQQTDQQR